MREYKYSCNYDHPLISELYDQTENYQDDVVLLQKILTSYKVDNVLELFCGTGRIMIPLAKEGFKVTGIDIAKSMIDLAIGKTDKLTIEERSRIKFRQRDVIEGEFGDGYELVIIGGNSLYELSSPEMQEEIIRLSYESLKPSGLLFIDNDDYKGNWGENEIEEKWITVFEGTGTNGDYGRLDLETIRFDQDSNILHMKRIWYCKTKTGEVNYTEYLSSKHPVAANRIKGWLEKYNFEIIKMYGDWQGNNYTEESKRAIFLAKKN